MLLPITGLIVLAGMAICFKMKCSSSCENPHGSDAFPRPIDSEQLHAQVQAGRCISLW
jgi:hypothetical protein